jgi:hypothetical protein
LPLLRISDAKVEGWFGWKQKWVAQLNNPLLRVFIMLNSLLSLIGCASTGPNFNQLTPHTVDLLDANVSFMLPGNAQKTSFPIPKRINLDIEANFARGYGPVASVTVLSADISGETWIYGGGRVWDKWASQGQYGQLQWMMSVVLPPEEFNKDLMAPGGIDELAKTQLYEILEGPNGNNTRRRKAFAGKSDVELGRLIEPMPQQITSLNINSHRWVKYGWRNMAVGYPTDVYLLPLSSRHALQVTVILFDFADGGVDPNNPWFRRAEEDAQKILQGVRVLYAGR